jgi:FkbM family methyltransferase
MKNPKFYSQCGEDKTVYEKYFKDKKDGVFLEMGAMDGVIYSNTKFFEDTLGWTGVLIEPHPYMFQNLATNRPNSKVYNFAISQTRGALNMLINPEHPAVSSISGTASDTFYSGWHKSSTTIKVPTIPLSDVLQHAKLDHIDFFSLDVEGSEYDVLCSMLWNVRVGVFLIESFSEDYDRNQGWRNLLVKNGYVFDGNCAHNELWIDSSRL